MATYTGNPLITKYSAYLQYKGTSTAAALNLSSPYIGYVYDISEGGKLTNGNIEVKKGDAVVYLNQGWTLFNNGSADRIISELEERLKSGVFTAKSLTQDEYDYLTEIEDNTLYLIEENYDGSVGYVDDSGANINIIIDKELKTNSANPVQNKAITSAIEELKTQIKESNGNIEIDENLSTESTNPVQNKVITTNLSNVNGQLSGLSNNVSNITRSLSTVSGSISALSTRVTTLENNTSSGDGTINTDNFVTLDTTQTITGTKIFKGSKNVRFRQGKASDKLGFTFYSNENNELAFFEYNTSGGTGFYLGNYYEVGTTREKCQIGFQIADIGGDADFAYNIIAPLCEDVVGDNAELKNNYSTETGNKKYKKYYMPLNFVNGSKKVTASAGGTVDLSELISSEEESSNYLKTDGKINNIVSITQSEFDNLDEKLSTTLYIITD